jgi:lipopolysaccharide transport system ATP-binding protein
MLEVGTGFHPELSGHDNIFLNGAIIGMSASDIRRRYDEIVAFSGVEDFLGLPIKRYSSGMVMRLAFAVAAHLEPDVLIIDEVLAVGDAAFQQKCMARMTEVRSSGCTLFFVSHNLAAVQQMCSRAILLRNGRLAADGPTSETVTAYLAGVGLHSRPSTWIRLQSTHIARGPKVTAIRYGSPLVGGSPPCSLGPLHVDVEIHAPEPSQAILAIDIKDEFGNLLINADLFKKQSQTLTLASGPNLFRLSIDSLPLEAGRYFLDVWLADPLGRTTDLQKSVSDLELRTALGEYAPSDRSPQRDGLVPCSFAVTPLPSAANGPSTEA